MARLDPFIDRLFTEPALRLELESGAGAVLQAARGAIPVIRQPLTVSQIVGALAERLPDELKSAFPRPGTTAFPYRATAGTVDVRLELADGGARATLVPRRATP